MKLIKVYILLFVFVCPVYLPLYGQTVPHTVALEEETEEHKFKHARVSVVLYHTHLGTQTQKGKEFISVPSLGLDLEYWFTPTWGIGLHNDLEIIAFEVKQGEHHSVKRERPVLVTVDGLYKPWKGLVLLAGAGVEIEKRDNLFVVRAGVEYEIDMKDHWDVTPAVFYDNRLQAYDTFTVGIGIGKRF